MSHRTASSSRTSTGWSPVPAARRSPESPRASEPDPRARTANERATRPRRAASLELVVELVEQQAEAGAGSDLDERQWAGRQGRKQHGTAPDLVWSAFAGTASRRRPRRRAVSGIASARGRCSACSSRPARSWTDAKRDWAESRASATESRPHRHPRRRRRGEPGVGLGVPPALHVRQIVRYRRLIPDGSFTASAIGLAGPRGPGPSSRSGARGPGWEGCSRAGSAR